MSRHSQRSLSAIRPKQSGDRCCRLAAATIGLRITRQLRSFARPVARSKRSMSLPAHDEVVFLAAGDLGTNVGRYLGDHMGFRSPPLQHAINQPVGTEILDPGDAEREGDVVVPGLDSARQEGFRPEAKIGCTVLDQVHRRRADEGRDEGVGRVDVDLLRRPDLADLALVEHGNPVAQSHRLGLVVGDVDRRGAETALEMLELIAGGVAQLGVEIR